MSQETVFLLIGFTVLATLNFYFLRRFSFRTKEHDTKDDSTEQGFRLLQNQITNLTQALDARLNESGRQMADSVRQQFSESQRVIRDTNEQLSKHLMDVTRGVTENSEAAKRVVGITEQLQNLEKVLKHQKQRGTLGEASLELVLGNILPPTGYKNQYRFEDGAIVDAVIFTKEGLIPIDAKFSLDNYNRLISESDETLRAGLERDFKNDLKRRIDETAKYIKPKEDTLPFAFMYIPAEGIYYDLLVNEVGSVKVNTRSLIDYAYNEKKVIIVSPTTFSAYLQSVLFGFKAYQYEKNAEQIMKNVELLGKHVAAYEEYFQKIGNTLNTTFNHYNRAYSELGKINKDVLRITGEDMGIEPELLARVERE